MLIYMSVVSHGDELEIINGLKPHLLQCETVKIIIRDNVNSSSLKEYCKLHDIIYVANNVFCGFGENNNLNFSYLVTKELIGADDFFIVTNPDVIINRIEILNLATACVDAGFKIATLNLFKDDSFKVLESNVRKFPHIWDFVASFLLKSSQTIHHREGVSEPMRVDWASGSFLLFNAKLFEKLGGFDPGYYMYCEDVDICWRAKQLFSVDTYFVPSAKAIHAGKWDSRKFRSKLTYYHIFSALRFSVIRFWRIFGGDLYPK